jgi:NAD+ synthetase
MKIALAQINPTIANLDLNLNKILQTLQKAKSEKVDLLVFPELSIVGYPPLDLLDDEKLISENLAALQKIVVHCSGISVVVGYVEPNPSSIGKPFFNAAVLIQDKKIRLNYRKKLLPYYGVFNDERYFQVGEEDGFFSIGNTRFAITICEDAWGDSLDRQYAVDPLKKLSSGKIDWIINLSASPFELGKSSRRLSVFKEFTEKTGSGVFFCNQVGGNDDLLFDGGSFALNKGGELIAQGKNWEEDLVIIDLAGEKKITPSFFSEEHWLENALVTGVRDYVKKNGISKICLGLSGGIDSAVCAVVAAKAVGSQNVHSLAMPSRFTAAASNEDAEQLAENLGIHFSNISIESVFKSYQDSLIKLFPEVATLTLENLQPRIRMTYLMALSNQERSVLLNTSNKSEITTGYSTLYGDSAGALSPLGDLTKAQVYSLARWFNRDKEVIPARILERAPTAELREGQVDEDSLPPYSVLDSLVVSKIEKLEALNSGEHAARFTKLYRASEFKRAQFPPILRISSRAFGRGRKVPITSLLP